MPLYLINFIGGMILGYYLLNGTVRHLINQVILTILKLAHKVIVYALGLLLRGLNWCYLPRQKAQQPVQGINPTRITPQPTQAANKGARKDAGTVVVGGKKRLWLSDEKLAEMMKNPDVKISEKDVD